MKLLTKEIERKIPAIYSQDGKGDEAIVYVKFFNPLGAAVWFATEYNPEERMFFGYADLFGDGSCGELGYFSLDELQSVNVGLGLGIERDTGFTPCTLAEAKRDYYSRFGGRE